MNKQMEQTTKLSSKYLISDQPTFSKAIAQAKEQGLYQLNWDDKQKRWITSNGTGLRLFPVTPTLPPRQGKIEPTRRT